MRREYNAIMNDKRLVFHAPLTSDGKDIVGGLEPTQRGTVKYTNDGAEFYYSALTYEMPISVLQAPFRVELDFKHLRMLNNYDYTFCVGHGNNGLPYYRICSTIRATPMALGYDFSLSSNRYDFEDFNGVFRLNQWYHFTAEFTGSELTIYLDDNILYHTVQEDLFTMPFQNAMVTLGNRCDIHRDRYGNCIIRDVKIYK